MRIKIFRDSMSIRHYGLIFTKENKSIINRTILIQKLYKKFNLFNNIKRKYVKQTSDTNKTSDGSNSINDNKVSDEYIYNLISSDAEEIRLLKETMSDEEMQFRKSCYSTFKELG